MGFVFVCPISTTQRKNPFYVSIPEGQAVTGVIMTDQLRYARLSRKASKFNR